MSLSRRRFLERTGLAVLSAPLYGRSVGSAAPVPPSIRKPPRLQPGDVVGLVSPAGAVYEAEDVEVVQETLAALGLKSRAGAHVLDRYGYLGGTDEARAADLNAMFDDPEVKAVLALRGGWGCNRLLPLLDYDAVRRHPKIVVGYSDITSLLVALYAKTGLVTFHGPVGISTWNPFSVDYFRRILFDGEAVRMENPADTGSSLVQTDDRVQTITPGRARGRLVGGNLTVLTSMMGSPYLPDWRGHILFLEDTGEEIYRIDRMLTQLRLAGVLEQLAGFVFGTCTNCDPGRGYGSLTLMDVFADHLRPLGIPAWYGSMIGHISDKFTMPLGVEAEVDAEAGTITLLEPAVA